jgi:hypothetical protein
MSSVLVSGNALITGGTFTQVNNNDGHYHRFQGAFLFENPPL